MMRNSAIAMACLSIMDIVGMIPEKLNALERSINGLHCTTYLPECQIRTSSRAGKVNPIHLRGRGNLTSEILIRR